jgi:hypothetical protein
LVVFNLVFFLCARGQDADIFIAVDFDLRDIEAGRLCCPDRGNYFALLKSGFAARYC